MHCINQLNNLVKIQFPKHPPHWMWTAVRRSHRTRLQSPVGYGPIFALTFQNLKLGKYAILISFNAMLLKRPCIKPGPVWRYSPCIYLLIIGRHGGRHATKWERMLRTAQKAYLCTTAPRHRLPISRQPRPSSGSISEQYPTHCWQQITTVITRCKHSAFCLL